MRSNFPPMGNIKQNTHGKESEDGMGATIANKWHRKSGGRSKADYIGSIYEKINHNGYDNSQ